MADLLDDLLRTLDVRLRAFATCEVGAGLRLAFGPMRTVIVHYVLSGEGVLSVEGCGPVPIAPRVIAVVPAERAHGIAPDGAVREEVNAGESSLAMADGLMKIRTGDGSPQLLTVCGAIDATYGGGFGLFEDLVDPIVEDVSRYPEFSVAFDLLLREIGSPTIVSRPLTEAIMKQCLLLLIRVHVEAHGEWSNMLAALRDPRLGRAVLAILTRTGDPHTLASLAALCGMSRSAFAKRFGDVYGQTPFDFLQSTRLNHAAHLLSVADLPVKVVAKTVGYDSRSHFSRSFRDAYGLDPSRYRSQRATEKQRLG